jgi:geranylgeranyl diphosphate synthase type II
MIALPEFASDYQALVGGELERLVPAAENDVVREAMRYTLLSPSKRVRAILTMLSAEICGADRAVALPAAAAVEMIHSASLVLDDLPSMDNAPLRRGKPTNHVVFGEPVAILAAFGLMNLAFGVVARSYDAPQAKALTSFLVDAIGSDGLIGGQAEDLLATDKSISFETLERIHRRKTGALFSAAATAGALIAQGTRDQIATLAAYAKNLGLAFQIVDDLLDVEGEAATTGKAPRSDLKKTTFVSFSGAGGARELAGELCATATASLQPFGKRAARLHALAEFVARRVA